MKLWTSYFGNKDMLYMKDCAYLSVACGNPKYPVPYEIIDCKILKPYGIFGKKMSDIEYMLEYRAKLDKVGVKRIIEEIERCAGGHENVILLCHEKNPYECHRRDFADWYFEKTGTFVNEVIWEKEEQEKATRLQKLKEKEEQKQAKIDMKKGLDQLTIFDIL